MKCWSFHGYRGGAPLRIDCTGDELIRRKRDAWRSYWDPSTGFTNKTLNKVFEPMRCPERDSDVRPLACLWSAVLSSDESDQPFFSVPVGWASPSFEKVWVFSASALLRQLLSQGTKVIPLDLPLTAARLEWLATIFGAPSNRA